MLTSAQWGAGQPDCIAADVAEEQHTEAEGVVAPSTAAVAAAAEGAEPEGPDIEKPRAHIPLSATFSWAETSWPY